MDAHMLNDDLVRNLIALGLLSAEGFPAAQVNVEAKTGDYTITDLDPSDTIFTNRGAAGAVIFTLPAPSVARKGRRYRFVGVAGQNITVKTATADTLITKNDLTADSLAASTANELIGGVMEAVCDGTSWIVFGAAVGHTFTVAT